jgi:acyl carrier protein
MSERARDDVQKEVARILSSVLGHDIAPGVTIAAADDPVWDSLRQVEVMYAVEDTFGFRFEESDFSALVSSELIVDAVMQRAE